MSINLRGLYTETYEMSAISIPILQKPKLELKIVFSGHKVQN